MPIRRQRRFLLKPVQTLGTIDTILTVAPPPQRHCHQPVMTPTQPAAQPPDAQPDATAIAALIDPLRDQPGALLPMLHALQQAFGYVPEAALPLLALACNRSHAEVHGVISYYHFFRSAPAGRHVVQLCRAESCQACGGDALLAQAEALLGCRLHETRADAAVTLEPVYCLGLCAASPAMRIDDQLHARLTPERLSALLSPLQEQRA